MSEMELSPLAGLKHLKVYYRGQNVHPAKRRKR